MPAGDRPGLRSLLRGVPAAVRRDYVVTLLVQWFVLGVGLLLFHLVAQRGGVDGFAFYQIARSTVSTLQPVLLLGLGVGLWRYLPRTEHTTRRLARQAVAIEAALVTVVALAGAAAGDRIAGLLGMAGGRSAATAVVIMLGGNCLCTVALAALRGNHQSTGAVLTLGAGFGVTPLLAFALAARIEDFLILQGAGTALVGLCGTLAVRRPPPTTEKTSEPDVKILISYGVRRMPGEVALPALFTAPTFAVAVTMPGDPQAGYVGFTTSAVTLLCSVFAMLTPVLMPRLSRLFHRGEENSRVNRVLTLLPLIAAGLALIPTAVILLFAPAMIRGFLGPEFAGTVGVLRLGVLAAVPLAMFYAARPTLDTLLDAKIVSRMLLGCLALEMVVTGVAALYLSPPRAAVLGFVVGSAALGLDAVALTAHALRRRGR